jgi:outer membrane translocation and assembly module TamA
VEDSGCTLKEKRFGFEPEVTVKIAKRKLRVYEVGVSYSGRTYEEVKYSWKEPKVMPVPEASEARS